MPRAKFNTDCDFIYGPAASTPGVVYATVPCRIVWERYELPMEERLIGRIAYITMDAGRPTLALQGGTLDQPTLDYDYADRLAVPSGSAPDYLPLFTELVRFGTSSEYWRVHVENMNNRPLSIGCNGCPGSPHTWTVSYPAGTYDPPFNVGSFSIPDTLAGPGMCFWGWAVGGVMRVQLHLNAGTQMIFETDNYAFGNSSYLSVSPWRCFGVNRLYHHASNIICPPYVDVSCP